MIILIKGMEMPKNCWECHFGHGDSGVCVVDFKQHGDWNEPQNCPLVPVPPHGDLIDRDALMRHKGDCYDAYGHLLYAVGTGNILRAPTIIPAEEGET